MMFNFLISQSAIFSADFRQNCVNGLSEMRYPTIRLSIYGKWLRQEYM
jgi:hypothetical protein